MNNTKHNHQVMFGRKEAGCPRCEELKAGAGPRQSWHARYFAQQRRDELQQLRAIAAHDFSACAAKNVVCTHFDY